MTDEQLAAMHRLLAEHHRNLANEATLDVVQQYHADLAQRLADEAALIPRRTVILERLHECEQPKKEDGDVDKRPPFVCRSDHNAPRRQSDPMPRQKNANDMSHPNRPSSYSLSNVGIEFRLKKIQNDEQEKKGGNKCK